jgi:hypothetical protein
MRQQLLDAIYGGQPFRTVLRDLGLTSNQVWGLTKTDQEWAEKLDTALTATRRNDLKHGTCSWAPLIPLVGINRACCHAGSVTYRSPPPSVQDSPSQRSASRVASELAFA